MIVGDIVNARSAPGLAPETIKGQLKEGARVRLVGRPTSGWAEVECEPLGRVFVWRAFLRPSEADGWTVGVCTAVDGTAAFSGPDRSYAVVAKIGFREKVLTRVAPGRDWQQVFFPDGSTGWILWARFTPLP